MLNLNNARVKPPTLHSFTIELLIAVLLLQVILVCPFDFHLFVRSVSAPSDFCFVLAYHVFFLLTLSLLSGIVVILLRRGKLLANVVRTSLFNIWLGIRGSKLFPFREDLFLKGIWSSVGTFLCSCVVEIM